MKAKMVFLWVMLTALPTMTQAGDSVLGINFGMSIPVLPSGFRDYWNTGFNLGGIVGGRISDRTSLLVSLGYSDFGPEEDFYYIGSYTTGNDARIFTAFADLKYSLAAPSASVSPYLIAGAGLFVWSVDDGTLWYRGEWRPVEGYAERGVGFEVGTGLDFARNPRVSLSLGGKFAAGFTECETPRLFPLQIGILFK